MIFTEEYDNGDGCGGGHGSGCGLSKNYREIPPPMIFIHEVYGIYEGSGFLYGDNRGCGTGCGYGYIDGSGDGGDSNCTGFGYGYGILSGKGYNDLMDSGE